MADELETARPEDLVLTGKLLLAMPSLEDPNFWRTVILVLEHQTEEGAIGVILNRPSDTRVIEVLDDWAPYAADPDVVFVGGPVSRQSIVALAQPRSEQEPSTWQRITGQVGVIDLASDAVLVGAEVEGVRVFSGYAGWAPSQLEAEIAVGSWLIASTDDHDPLTEDPDGLWRRVFGRETGKPDLMELFPDNPSLN